MVLHLFRHEEECMIVDGSSLWFSGCSRTCSSISSTRNGNPTATVRARFLLADRSVGGRELLAAVGTSKCDLHFLSLSTTATCSFIPSVLAAVAIRKRSARRTFFSALSRISVLP